MSEKTKSTLTETQRRNVMTWNSQARAATDMDSIRPMSRNLKLSEYEWDYLARVAVREDLDWGGIPSRSEAIRWLIRRDQEQHDEPHKPIPD